MPNILSILVFFILSITLIGAQDILGCGGFVKSDVDINFSLVEIKLYTRQGTLKYQTDCAPNNGYYMVPLYDKGEYSLRIEPPAGWNFEPDGVDLVVDGTTDKCSRGEDINFQFKGFSILGQVTSKGQSVGPAGVTVSLRSKGSTSVLQVITSNKGGSFEFSKVLPGTYTVTATHPKWKFEKDAVSVTISKDNGNISGLMVSGYDIMGQVTSDGEPIRSVTFLLFSDVISSKEVQGCDKSPVHEYDMSGVASHYLCFVTSGDDGRFVFPTLQPGSYTLLPYYRGEHIVFDVVPAKLAFTVEHSSLVLSDIFQVQGFSVSGKVVASKSGPGVEGAAISINGKQQALTNKDGIYHLDSMRTGTYTFAVTKQHILFKPVTVRITPNTPRLPDVVAANFSVCGTVAITALPEGLPAVPRRKLILTHVDIKSDMVSITTDAGGKFCTQLPPGKYTLKVAITSDELKAGLSLTPTEHSLSVIDAPILDIDFHQFKATVSGSLHCMEKCQPMQVSIVQQGKVDEEPIAALDVGGSRTDFKFDDVLPGKYTVVLLHDNWCWKKKRIDVEVLDKDVIDVKFQHTGYIISCTSSHPLQLGYSQAGKSGETINVVKGINKFCLPQPGIYTLLPSSCHEFEQASYKFDTTAPSIIVLNAVRHLVSGFINTDYNTTSIQVNVRTTLSSSAPHLKAPRKGSGEFHFSYMGRNGEEVTFTPTHGQLLFYPPSQHAVIHSECLQNSVKFRAELGIFLDGFVTPALAGVAVTVTSNEDPNLKVTIDTDTKGKYRVGPLHKDAAYIIQAHKPGYIITEIENNSGNFKAFKLAQIVIKVVDESNVPLQGVLLSLSGGKFRSNRVTMENGTLLFSGLSPGQYFLRPVMKEYSFEPPSQMIEVAEGSNVDLKVLAVRIAFSCYGYVLSLSGEAEANIFVEAVGTGDCKQYQEECTSEANGGYRIRGLMPQCIYHLRIKSGENVNTHIHRSTPAFREVRAVKTDLHDVNLIVFRPLTQMDVTVHVIAAQEYWQGLKVKLYKDSDPDNPVYSTQLVSTNFIYLPTLPIDNTVYTVRLVSDLAKNMNEYQLPEETFTASEALAHIALPFNPKPKKVEQDVAAHGNYMALLVTIMLCVVGFNYTKLLPAFSQLGTSARGLMNPAATSSEVIFQPTAEPTTMQPPSKRKIRKA
ncbi:PREDICTED: nodal modulator 3-like isoform X2 [Priapulus caudatus]|uniref:Nodal modulator 3-like isoform X2 n=1 Tax=Priapulus caudatus TaxID=37621 RepID=A0ABM1E6C1_PRICU|nr:PREDICTED: nodal modulator 3-like isoform X2 [Priapulus caudatus]